MILFYITAEILAMLNTGAVRTFVFLSLVICLDQCRQTISFNVRMEKSSHNYYRSARQGSLATSSRRLPKPVRPPDIQSYSVHAVIKYRYVTTTIFSKVVNPADSAQEVNFAVSIPESAFISDFFMIIKGETYKARVKQKDEAKEEYDKAKISGQSSGLVRVSERDSNVFTVSVNVEANGDVGFNLTYEQFLQRTSGFYENQMNISPGQVVDVLDVSMTIEESASLTTLEVLTFNTDADMIEYKQHKNAVISKSSNKVADIRWNPNQREQEQISANGMKGLLIVRYDIEREHKSNQILVDTQNFVHFISPTNLPTLSKYSIFVLDISGSMTPKKMYQLKTAIGEILTATGDDDCFSLILFSEEVSLWSPKRLITIAEEKSYSAEFVIEGTQENIYAAVDFINKLQSRTSTNIIAALRNAVNLAKFAKEMHPTYQPIMFFLSDGDPNIEEDNPDVIIEKINALNLIPKCSIFSLAFGREANFKFLEILSKSNGGFAKKIYLASDTASQLTDFYKQISSPMLSDISLTYDPKLVNKSTLTETRFSNYFNGSELVVAGKITKDNDQKKFNLQFDANYHESCTGCDAVSDIEKIVVSGKASSDSGPLERLWAYMRVKQLLDQDLINGSADTSLKEEALELSLKYSFVTPLTSLIVVKPNEVTYTKIESSDKDPLNRRGTQIAAAIEPPTTSDPYSMTSIPPFTTMSTQLMTHARRSTDPPATDQPRNNTFYKRLPPKFGEYSINNVKWLNRTAHGIMLPNSKYIVDLNEMNRPYDGCTSVGDRLIYCVHMRHCIFAEILEDYSKYLTYQCVIRGIYAGICCPPE